MRKTLAGLALLFSLLGLFQAYQGWSQYFPFDFYWDMDATTTQDVLLQNAGYYPTHLDHPKYGMVQFLAITAQIAQQTGFLSTASLKGLKSSPHPLLPVAELTYFLRQTQAFWLWLMVAAAVWSLYKLFPSQSGLLWSYPLILGLQGGLIHVVSTLRTESFASGLVLFGMMAVLALPHTRRGFAAGMFLSGVGFSLAVLTKVQALLMLPLVLCFGLWHYLRSESEIEGSPRLSMGVWGAALILGVLLSLPAWYSSPLPGRSMPVATLSNPASLKLPLVWLGIFLMPGLGLWFRTRLPARLRQFSLIWPYFGLGISAGLLLPLCSYGWHLSQSWRYLMALLRASIWADLSATGAGSLADTLPYAWFQRPDYIGLMVGGLLLLGLNLKQQFQKTKIWPWADTALIGLSLSVVPWLFFSNRALLRDTVWYEWWGLFASLILLGHLRTSALVQERRWLLQILAIVPLLLAFNSGSKAAVNLDNSYLSNAQFGFDGAPYDYFWINSVYLRDPQNPYAQVMNQAYQMNSPLTQRGLAQVHQVNVPLIRRGLAQARQVKDWQRLLDPLWLNLRLPTSHISLLEPGFGVVSEQNQWWRVAHVDAQLLGEPIVSLKDLPLPRQGQRYIAHQLPQGSGLGRLAIPPKAWTLLPSFHQETVILVGDEDLKRSGKSVPTSADLTLTRNGQTRHYHGFRLTQPCAFTPEMQASFKQSLLVMVRTQNIQPYKHMADFSELLKQTD